MNSPVNSGMALLRASCPLTFNPWAEEGSQALFLPCVGGSQGLWVTEFPAIRRVCAVWGGVQRSLATTAVATSYQKLSGLLSGQADTGFALRSGKSAFLLPTLLASAGLSLMLLPRNRPSSRRSPAGPGLSFSLGSYCLLD